MDTIRSMRAKPIGSRIGPPRHAAAKRKPLRAGTKTDNGPADIYPVTIRINAGPSKGRVQTFARLIITTDALYIATSPDKGKTIGTVTRYDHPTGTRTTTGGKKGHWGAFSWSGCGCANSWGLHTRSKLVTLGDNTDRS